MKERIEELMRQEGLTSVKFAEILSVQPSNISHILSGRNNPSYDFILKLIERFPSVNIEWLMTGNGSIYKSNLNRDHKLVTTVNNTQPSIVTDVNNNVRSINRQYEQTHNSSQMPFVEESVNKIQTTQNEIVFDDPNAVLDQISHTPANIVQKQVTKIILFYSDNTFEIYNS